MHVTVFGTGYVGLVSGSCLAEVGNQVTCVDIDAEKVAALESGVVPIHERGLAPLVRGNREAGRLRFTTDAARALARADVVLIAVGTPPGEDGGADLHHVLEVARTIGRLAAQPCVVVLKSTVPVGTTARGRATTAAALAERGVDPGIAVVANPEFLKEGDAVNDCMRPDRIVIGSDDPGAIALLRELYAPFNRRQDRIVTMDVRSAELTKYAANAMLATRISLMNEIAAIAEQVGADVEMVRKGIGSDPRIGWQFLFPGAGYGGSCFPKDVRALAHTARGHGCAPRLLDAVAAVNDAQQGHLFALACRHYGSPAAL